MMKRGKTLYMKEDPPNAGDENMGRIPHPCQTHGVEPTPQSVIDDGLPEVHVMPPAAKFISPTNVNLDTEANVGTAYHCLLDASGKDTAE